MTIEDFADNGVKGVRRQLFNRLEELRKEHAECLAEIREYQPDFDPDQPLPPTNIQDLSAALTHEQTCVAHFHITDLSGYVSLLVDGQWRVVPLPNANRERIRRLQADWSNRYQASQDEDGVLDGDVWNAAIMQTVRELSEVAVQPWIERIPDSAARLLLVPHRELHVFPFHVCPTGKTGSSGSGELVCDRHVVQYTPSLSILSHCRRRPRTKADRLLTVQVPQAGLEFAAVEIEQIQKRLAEAATVLPSSATVKDALYEAARSTHILHHVGHSEFVPADPLSSTVELGAPGDTERTLTVREIFTRLRMPEARLAVLSSCESGMVTPEEMDELVSFPTALLYSGAAAGVFALWEVPDIPTCLLMSRLYGRIRQGLAPAEALHQSQRWLRGVPDDRGECLENGQAAIAYFEDIGMSEITEELAAEKIEYEIADLTTLFADRPPYADPFLWAAFHVTGAA